MAENTTQPYVGGHPPHKPGRSPLCHEMTAGLLFGCRSLTTSIDPIASDRSRKAGTVTPWQAAEMRKAAQAGECLASDIVLATTVGAQGEPLAWSPAGVRALKHARTRASLCISQPPRGSRGAARKQAGYLRFQHPIKQHLPEIARSDCQDWPGLWSVEVIDVEMMQPHSMMAWGLSRAVRCPRFQRVA